MKRQARSVEIEQLNPNRKPGDQPIYKVRFFEYDLLLSHWPVDEFNLTPIVINWILNGVRPK